MVQRLWCRCSAEVLVQHRCIGTEVQRYRGTEVQVQRCSGAKVQRCRGAEVQKCRGAEVQRCRVGAGAAGKKVQWLYKGAKEVKRRCRGGAEAVQSRCRDAVTVQRFITGDYAAEGAE
jgi:hypothetical protein